MHTFLVSYDLARPDLNQAYLADAIMSLGAAWARPLANVWYVRSIEDQASIEARLSRLLDENDGLLIQATRGEAVLRNTGLRWFRQRRRTYPELEHANDGNIIAFLPSGAGPGRPAPDLAGHHAIKVAS